MWLRASRVIILGCVLQSNQEGFMEGVVTEVRQDTEEFL